MDKRIVIGKVLKPQGVKGEVKVLPITYDPHRFHQVNEVACGTYTLQVESCRIGEGFVYLTFAGLTSRDAVEKLRNLELSLPREQAITLPEDTWFIVDLIGCRVMDDTGKALGTVTDVLQNGGADVYELDHGKVLFPALKKLLVSVDVSDKQIVVNRSVLGEVAVYED